MIPQNMQAYEGTRKIILAEYQTEYTPLPALRDPVEGTFLTEWAFTDEERALIAAGGVLRFWVWGMVFQPVVLQVVPVEEKLPLEPVS